MAALSAPGGLVQPALVCEPKPCGILEALPQQLLEINITYSV